jgi:hypothetical protein
LEQNNFEADNEGSTIDVNISFGSVVIVVHACTFCMDHENFTLMREVPPWSFVSPIYNNIAPLVTTAIGNPLPSSLGRPSPEL